MSKIVLALSRVSLVIVTLLVLVSLLTQSTAASSSWFSGQNPTLTKDKNITNSEFNELKANRQGITAGLSCIDKKVARRKIANFNFQYIETCWYETEIGLLSTAGDYLLQPGTEVAAHIGTSSPTQPRYFPTINRNVFLEMTPDGVASGYRLAFRKLENMLFTRSDHTTGTATVTVVGSADYTPLNSQGNTIFTSNHDIWWSNDGRYMLHYGERGTINKFNLDELNVTNISVFQRSGISRGSVAISPSGRYVAFTIERPNSNDLVLIDTINCGLSAGKTVQKPAVPCDMIFYKDFLEQNIPDFNMVRLPRFFGEHTIGFYHYTGSINELYYLQAPGTDFEKTDYLALGDSFSSGEGAFDYIDGTDVHSEPGRNLCHNSSKSYPYLINERVNLTGFLSVACSGAIIEDYYFYQYGDYENLYINPHPGKTKQSEYIISKNIFTLTMSGNDIGFAKKLEYCLLSNGACYSSYEDRLEIVNQILTQHPRLVSMYRHIIDNSAKGRLFVLGYPQIMSNRFDAKCGLNVGFNTYQRIMAHNLITYFNSVIKSAAENAGAYYVDVEESFSGHKLCDDTSATISVNGLTKGDDLLLEGIGPIGNESYHPNQLGHQILATEVLHQTDQLTKPMPEPKTSSVPSAEFSGFLGQEPVHREIRDLYYVNLSRPALIQRGTKLLISILSPVKVNPLASFEAVLHSDPVNLGVVTANGAGDFSFEITIPTDTKPGMHELHLLGNDASGNPVDFYQYVYVAASTNDFDGDGILDRDEPCGIINPSNEDVDKDGVDDACDPFIAKLTSSFGNDVPSSDKNHQSGNQGNNEVFEVQSTDENNDDPGNTGSVLSTGESDDKSHQTFSNVSGNDPIEGGRSKSWIVALLLTVVAIMAYSVYKYAVKEKE